MIPIWKDKDVILTPDATGRVPFTIMVDGSSAYLGVAVSKGIGNCEVRVNDIVADYLYNIIPSSFTPDGGLSEAEDTAYNVALPVQVIDRNDGTSKMSDVFKYDWSYDNAVSAATKFSDPINGRIDPRMPLIWTSYVGADTTIKIVGYARTGDFLYEDYNNDYSASNVEDHLTINVAEGAHNIYLYGADVAKYQWLVRDEDGFVYKVVTPCHRYALYYVNAYGGIDFLLLEGTCKMQDNLTRYTTKKTYNNSTPSARGKTEYLNEQVRIYTLNTGLMTEAEASKMHHLLESTNVCLWDNVEGVMRPVVLTDNNVAHKTYKGEGRNLIRYPITADLARDRQRR